MDENMKMKSERALPLSYSSIHTEDRIWTCDHDLSRITDFFGLSPNNMNIMNCRPAYYPKITDN